MRIRKGVPEEGYMLDRKRMFPIGGKAQSLGQGTRPARKDMLDPIARWPPTGRPEHSQSDLGLGPRLLACRLEWSRTPWRMAWAIGGQMRKA